MLFRDKAMMELPPLITIELSDPPIIDRAVGQRIIFDLGTVSMIANSLENGPAKRKKRETKTGEHFIEHVARVGAAALPSSPILRRAVLARYFGTIAHYRGPQCDPRACVKQRAIPRVLRWAANRLFSSFSWVELWHTRGELCCTPQSRVHVLTWNLACVQQGVLNTDKLTK